MYIKPNSVYVEPGTLMDTWATMNEKWIEEVALLSTVDVAGRSCCLVEEN